MKGIWTQLPNLHLFIRIRLKDISKTMKSKLFTTGNYTITRVSDINVSMSI